MLVKRNGRRSKLISKSFCFENYERFTQQKKKYYFLTYIDVL